MGEKIEKSVLIVDDIREISDILTDALQTNGYTAVQATSGEEALNILKSNRIRLFFLDIHLPGMNGIYLCSRIKKLYPDAYCCAITGYNTTFELKDCMDAGFDNYLSKPVDLEKFLSIVAEGFKKAM